EFLLRVGPGAGPYYGIWTPEQIVAEFSSLAQEFEAEFGSQPDPGRPFPISRADSIELQQALLRGDPAPLVERAWPADGCLAIGHQGCSYWTVLVTAGELTGTVWDLSNQVGFDGEWLPARRPPG